jgi:hypothetical protein
MLAMGHLHRPVPAPEPLPATVAEATAYILPDGSLPDLCLSGKQPDGQQHHRLAGQCDACLLTSSPGLPLADTHLVPDLVTAGLGHAPFDTGTADGQFADRPCSRGPPRTSIQSA